MSDIVGAGKVAESVEKLTQEVRTLLYDFASPIAKEAGEWLADAIRFRRIVRVQSVIDTIQQAKASLDSAGIKAQVLQLKTLIPLLEQCSLEEEPDMIRRWANLLAAASVGDPVTPSYVRVLAELTPDQAKVLDCVERLKRNIRIKNDDGPNSHPILAVEISAVQSSLSISPAYLREALLNLQRVSLLKRCFSEATFLLSSLPIAINAEHLVGLTEFGVAFLRIVNHPPKKLVDLSEG